MPLTLHTSNRLESLADALAATLRAHPLPPLTSERVVVQSLGLGRWLSFQLAERLGVAMNVAFPFPAALVEDAFTTLLPATPPAPRFRREVLPWRIHAVLPGLLAQENFADLARYANTDARKLWQLSAQLAAVFDRYMAYRPELLRRWDAGKMDAGEEWQAQLWRSIAERAPHPAALADALRKSTEPAFAEKFPRLCIFGISTLPPFYLALLGHLATLTEVHLFLLAPTQEYWGDVRGEKEQARYRRWQAKRGTSSQPTFEQGHPLLASLGKIGREFHEALLDLTPTAEHEHFTTPSASTLLGALQRDILTLSEPGKDALELRTLNETAAADATTFEVQSSKCDTTIQLHDCHSPLRELEVLHDQLLSLFDHDPTLTPRDVLVAVPDIAAYAPFVEAVFGAPECDAHRFPYSIADHSARGENHVADAFLRILDCVGSRFPASAVMALLDCPAIRERFDLSEAEVALCREWTTRSGIRWGVDEQHRAKLGLPPVRENTWRFGLDRLLLGAAMAGDGEQLHSGILPDEGIEGSLALTLGAFADFCTQLFTASERFSTAHLSLAEWAETLRETLTAFCASKDDFADDWRAVSSQLHALAENAALAEHQAPVPFSIVHAHLTAALAEPARGGSFLRGGVTFCSLKPMRAIPHRIVAMLGLGDGAFPRTTRPPAFDLAAASPRPGDRTLRDDDRYLFLEAILSARDTLYLSHCGQSARDNSASPPSVLVCELLDVLERSYSGERGALREQLTTRHRLHAFSADYFTGDPRRISYSAENANAARIAATTRHTAPAFASALPAVEVERELSLRRLTDCLLHPAKFFASERLGLSLPSEVATLEDTEPFTLGGLEKYALKDELTRSTSANPRALARASGILPSGFAGDSDFAEAELVARHLAKQIARFAPGETLEPANVSLVLGDWKLSGTLAPLVASALIQQRPAKLKAKDLLRAWLSHLLLCATAPAGLQPRTVLVAEDAAFAFTKLPAAAATAELSALLALYEQAHREPLRFFPQTSLTFAEREIAKPAADKNADSAAATWHGSDFGPRGECEDEWNALIWRNTPAPLDEDWRALALAIFRPLLAARENLTTQ